MCSDSAVGTQQKLNRQALLINNLFEFIALTIELDFHLSLNSS